MDKKEFTRKSNEYIKAKKQMLIDKEKSDRKMHSEDKTWNVDYKTGTLKEEV